jgi:hypothetical protein
MRPKKHETIRSDDLSRARLHQAGAASGQAGLGPYRRRVAPGKASAPYELGMKAFIVTTNARAPGGQFVLHTRTLPGNPYNGRTLGAVIEATQRLTGQ